MSDSGPSTPPSPDEKPAKVQFNDNFAGKLILPTEEEIQNDPYRRRASSRRVSRRMSKALAIADILEQERQYVIGDIIDLDTIVEADDIEEATTRTRRFSSVVAASRKSQASTKDWRELEEAGDESSGEDEDYLIEWEGPEDPKNPYNWSKLYRFFCLFTVSMQGFCVAFYSSSYTAGIPGMMAEFGITNRTITVLGVSAYLFGMGVAPLILAPLSEMYGRRIVYIIGMASFTIFIIPACVAKNIQTIIIIRFLGAVSGSVGISNAPGTIADIYQSADERSKAFAVFAITAMNGPPLGTIIGGVLFRYLGWRSINYFSLIAAGIFFVAGFFVAETYGPHILREKARHRRLTTGDDKYFSRFDFPPATSLATLLRRNFKRPLKMLFTEAICLAWALYLSVIYALLYMSFIAYPVVFMGLRGWEPQIAGLGFVGILIGTSAGVATDPLSRWGVRRHKVDPETGKIPPEALIWFACVGAVLASIGLWIFAWTCDPGIVKPWVFCILAGIPYGLGTTVVFTNGWNYLLSSYSIYAASAMAGNAISRSFLGGILPLFAPKMYSNLSPAIASTILATLATALMPIPFIFYFWGKHFRERSPMLLALAAQSGI
ncbi:Major facilitator superfamily multidrug transporter [Drechslerella dactyloides]|uniref:Major facilitator superfamily multidrug transporter n=1 Tax=Drechslerella dactyloides TaxID=74499 RepID=A0AAD6ISK5_DREDA|nr:Major facilitator superfamily multidrug transporter [Drechslerella dactyloides]